MDDEAYNKLLGPKRFMSWSKENPMWWITYRTTHAGSFDAADKKEWDQCGVKYIIFFDHSKEDLARLFAMRVMDRESHFKAAKVSKFARDGEKMLVFLGKDYTKKNAIEYAAKENGFVLWQVRGLDEETALEKHLSDKYAEYLMCLANAFRGNEPDGGVRFNRSF